MVREPRAPRASRPSTRATTRRSPRCARAPGPRQASTSAMRSAARSPCGPLIRARSCRWRCAPRRRSASPRRGRWCRAAPPAGGAVARLADRQRRLHAAARRQVAALLVEHDALGADGGVALPEPGPAGVGAAPLLAVVLERRGAGEERPGAPSSSAGVRAGAVAARARRPAASRSTTSPVAAMALAARPTVISSPSICSPVSVTRGRGVALAADQHQPVARSTR